MLTSEGQTEDEESDDESSTAASVAGDGYWSSEEAQSDDQRRMVIKRLVPSVMSSNRTWKHVYTPLQPGILHECVCGEGGLHTLSVCACVGEYVLVRVCGHGIMSM